MEKPTPNNTEVEGSGTGSTAMPHGSPIPVMREALTTCPAVVYSPMVERTSSATKMSPLSAPDFLGVLGDHGFDGCFG